MKWGARSLQARVLELIDIFKHEEMLQKDRLRQGPPTLVHPPWPSRFRSSSRAWAVVATSAEEEEEAAAAAALGAAALLVLY